MTLTEEELKVSKSAVSLAATVFQTPAWRRQAKSMEKALDAGVQPDPKELDFVLTVLEQGRSNYSNSMLDLNGQETNRDRITINAGMLLRDRIRKAA